MKNVLGNDNTLFFSIFWKYMLANTLLLHNLIYFYVAKEDLKVKIWWIRPRDSATSPRTLFGLNTPTQLVVGYHWLAFINCCIYKNLFDYINFFVFRSMPSTARSVRWWAWRCGQDLRTLWRHSNTSTTAASIRKVVPLIFLSILKIYCFTPIKARVPLNPSIY